jgi:uncharacterized protein (TIGR02145 family)
MNFFTRQGRALLFAAILFIAAQTALAQQQQNYTGNGGKGISLTIYVPQSTGLAKNQNYIPALVQGEFVSTFSNYSAISILDWERLDDIYVKLVNEAYDDNAAAKQDVILGRLAPTSHFLTGNITKTATGYNIKMNITATADKMTVATYSGTFSFAELDNLTGVRRASLELLQKVGVTLTEKARQELWGAADANQVLAQTALARGVTAQRAGTEVAALSYFYQAASFNPALKEAVKRSSITAANIKSGNIGADIRNDILWRKNWVARLKETEEAFYEMIETADPPYTLAYFTDIKTGKIDYETETADFSITIYIHTNKTWVTAMNKALEAAQAVLDGLNATNRKEDWKLSKWPWEGVSNTNPFADTKEYDITVTFQLVNQLGRVIGSQTVELNKAFGISGLCNRLRIWNWGEQKIVNFEGVRANDISDNLTIRVATVNKLPPQQARFTITAMTSLVENSPPFTDTRNGKKYNTVRIGGKTWMAEDLNYKPQTGNSWCYSANNPSCDKYGRYYDWNTAMKVCPIGWRLPSLDEWNELLILTDGINNKQKLKSKSGWYFQSGDRNNGTDDYGFSALPGGYRRSYGGFVVNDGQASNWWTATECSSSSAFKIDIEISGGGGASTWSHFNKVEGLSVRCVAD